MPSSALRESPALAELRLLTEIQQRRECRRSFLAFSTKALAPLDLAPAAHHRLLISELEAVIHGSTRRLMVNMPPGSAKSTYASVLFPAWAFAQRPRLDVIGASNVADLAEGFSRRVTALIGDQSPTLGYHLTRDTAADWATSNGGHYRAAGIGGAIAGVRADIVLIDDPTRSRADAESETVRDKQWAWFTGDLRTRLKPGARIVVIMTRWHPDDLGGRLLERQPGLWRVISLPAIAEENDALGRQPGEWLWSDSDGYDYAGELQAIHAEYETAGAMRDWAALFQQRPRAMEGALFKTDLITILDASPPVVAQVRAWDLAATAQVGTRNPDWTVGVRLGRLADNRYIVMDVVRVRGGPADIEALILATASQDGKNVPISLPQDPGQAGKSQVRYLAGLLSGYTIHTSPETGDKATRASPVASQCGVGNLLIVRAGWNAAFKDELAGFPGGLKDDQVDALSRAFSHVALTPRIPFASAIVSMAPRLLTP